MSYRHAVVLSTTSFFLGVLFISFNVDYRLLYGEVTPEAFQAALQFYTTFYTAPVAVKTLLHSLIGIDIFALVLKVNKWDESALYFDMSSLGEPPLRMNAYRMFLNLVTLPYYSQVALMGAVILYLAVVVPGVKTLMDPLVDEIESERVEVLRIIGAGNTMAIGCLVAVLAMQASFPFLAGQEWARRYAVRELEKFKEAETKAAKTQ
ncbi:hypothetical protein FRB96_001669 [Tulasnella sp. 330]|nr:hypothetical protein FRB96_001669 [Tulasnella sp. 330]KAG8882575.1 hypothetical protein FRB97_008084 [Tulasnella sp. 331]KAG8888136.1 hypothetical protein FRB98_008328 [Tulasnella sp. 332]